MSISKIKTPSLPLALGLILSAGFAGLSGAPAFAQGAADNASLTATPVQNGGVEILLKGDQSEVVSPDFVSAALPVATLEGFPVEGGPGGPGERGWKHHGMFSEANKLTDDQAERLYAIKEDTHDQIALKKVQAHILGRKLRDTLSASSVDTAAAKDLEGKIVSLKSEIETLKLDGMIKASQVFTPEQRHELHMHMIRGGMHHHGHHHHGFGGHGHGGPGGPGGPGCGPSH